MRRRNVPLISSREVTERLWEEALALVKQMVSKFASGLQCSNFSNKHVLEFGPVDAVQLMAFSIPHIIYNFYFTTYNIK